MYYVHDLCTYLPHSNRNNAVTVNSMVLSSQIVGVTSFVHPIELNFQLTVSETVQHLTNYLSETYTAIHRKSLLRIF